MIVIDFRGEVTTSEDVLLVDVDYIKDCIDQDIAVLEDICEGRRALKDKGMKSETLNGLDTSEDTDSNPTGFPGVFLKEEGNTFPSEGVHVVHLDTYDLRMNDTEQEPWVIDRAYEDLKELKEKFPDDEFIRVITEFLEKNG